jgi:hypothetical protein
MPITSDDIIDDPNIGGIPLSWIGAPNGVAPLDGSSTIPIAYLPAAIVSGLTPKGPWDASGGTFPTPTKIGEFWWISIAGTIGGVDYEVNDWLVYLDETPDVWAKVDNTEVPIIKNCGQYWVSDKYGNDLTGDGGIQNPYKTIQAVLDYLYSLTVPEYIRSEIIVSGDMPNCAVSIPTGVDRVNIINLTGGDYPPFYIDLTIDEFSWISIKGIFVNSITEVGNGSKAVILQDCQLGIITSVAVPAIQLILYQTTIMSLAGLIASTDFVIGNFYDISSGFAEKMGQTGSPTIDEHVATKKYVDDTIIADHDGLNNLEWSNADHVIDTDVDMDGNKLINVAIIEGDGTSPTGIESTSDIDMKLGDAAGVNKLKIIDSGDVEVAAVDSDGNISLLGTVDGVDISALSSSIMNGLVVGSSFTKPTNHYIYDVVFSVAYADANYNISIEGEESRLWRFENQTASGFRINTNSGVALGALSKVTWLTKKI